MIKMKKVSPEKIKNNSIPIFSMIMFAFFPTSFQKEIGGNLYIIVLWLILTAFVLTVFIRNAVDTGKLRLVIFTLLYMCGVSMIQMYNNKWARISIARIAPLVVLLLTLTIVVKKIPDFSVMERLTDIFSAICIIWNVGILLQFSPVVDFTKNFYSQYYDRALHYSMLYRKPVMGFGVHTFAAFYYFLMFICYYGLAQKRHKIKDYLLCFIYICFTALLTSNSSLIYTVVMLCMYVWLIRKKVFVILSVVCAGILILYQNSEWILHNYMIFLRDGRSGFQGRYVGSNTFLENFEVIKSSLGIGFCILDNKNIIYSDSGYVMYLTMGGIILLVLLYSLIILFVRDNIPKMYRLPMIFLIMSFEVALPGTFSYRFVFALVFAVCFFQSLEKQALDAQTIYPPNMCRLRC